VPLQAADMVAYEMNKEWQDDEYPDNPGVGKARTQFRPLVEKFALNNGLAYGSCYTAGGLSVRVLRHNIDSVDQISAENFRRIFAARPGKDIEFMPYPASGIGEYVLVDSCPDADSPHLHIRESGACLGKRQAERQVHQRGPAP
jgi:hypothetical protein